MASRTKSRKSSPRDRVVRIPQIRDNGEYTVTVVRRDRNTGAVTAEGAAQYLSADEPDQVRGVKRQLYGFADPKPANDVATTRTEGSLARIEDTLATLTARVGAYRYRLGVLVDRLGIGPAEVPPETPRSENKGNQLMTLREQLDRLDYVATSLGNIVEQLETL